VPSRSSPKPGSPSSTRKKLDRSVVQQRIADLLANGSPNAAELLAFAEFIHGKPFPEPVLNLTQLKGEVCRVFGCQSAAELRNQPALLPMPSVHLSGPCLGHPKSDPELVAEETRQCFDHQRQHNAVESGLPAKDQPLHWLYG